MFRYSIRDVLWFMVVLSHRHWLASTAMLSQRRQYGATEAGRSMKSGPKVEMLDGG